MIDSSKEHKCQLASELQNLRVFEKQSNCEKAQTNTSDNFSSTSLSDFCL